MSTKIFCVECPSVGSRSINMHEENGILTSNFIGAGGRVRLVVVICLAWEFDEHHVFM